MDSMEPSWKQDQPTKTGSRCARFVVGDYWCTSSITAIKEQLQWESLAERSAKARATMVYRIINHLVFTPQGFLTPSTVLSQTRGGLYKLHKNNFVASSSVLWNGLDAAQLKHYHQNILGIFWDVPVGNSGISSWESECCLFQAMVRNSGNGQNLLGICWEFWRNMQMRFTGTKCLIRHWEYFPVWILGMLCKIPIRFSQCLIRHWEWWETAGNSLGNSTNCANEMFRYKMSDQTPGISPRLSQYKYWECYARFLPYSAFPSACDQTLGILAQYKCWNCR